MVMFLDEDFKNIPTDQQIDKPSSIPAGTPLTPKDGEMELSQETLPILVEPEQSGQTGIGLLDETLELPEGVAKGILTLPDALINSGVDLAIKAFPSLKNTFGEGENGRDYLNRLINSGNYEQQKTIIPFILAAGYGGEVDPKTAYGRTLKTIGEFAGLSPYVSALTKAGANLTAKLPQITDTTIAQMVRRNVVEPYLKNPISATKVETAIAGVAGAGAALEKEIFDTETGLGSIILPMSAVAIGAAPFSFLQKIPSSRVISWAKNKYGTYRDNKKIERGAEVFDESSASRKAAESVSKDEEFMLSDPRGRESAEKAQELIEKVQPYSKKKLSMSVAEATENIPGLKGQSIVESQMRPDSTMRNIGRKQNWFDSLRAFIKGETNSADYDDGLPVMIVNKIKNRNENLIKKIDDKQGEVQTVLDDVVNDLEFNVDKSVSTNVSGQKVQSRILDAKNTAMKNMDKRSKEFGLDKTDVNITKTSLANTIQKIQDDVLEGVDENSIAYGTINKTLTDLLKNLKDGSPVKFKEWRRINEDINAQLSRAYNLNIANDIRDLTGLQKVWNEVEFRGNNAKLKENLDLWKEEYRKNVIAPFRDGTVDKVIAKGSADAKGDGEIMFVLPGEKVATAFLRDTKTINQYNKIFQNDVEAQNYIQNSYLDKLLQKAKVQKEGGAIYKPDKIAKVLNQDKSSGILKALNLEDRLGTVAETIEALQRRTNMLYTRGQKLNSNLVIKAISKLDEKGNPAALINQAIESKDNVLLNEITKTVRSLANKADTKSNGEELINAYNGVILNSIMSKAPIISGGVSGNQIFSSAENFLNFLVAGQSKLTAALGKEHYDNLLLVADGFRKISLTGVESGRGTDPGRGFVQILEEQWELQHLK